MKNFYNVIVMVVVTLFLTSCDYSRYIGIDLNDYPDLEDNSQCKMIITNPNEPDFADTISWNGKWIKYEMSDTKQEYLAFVDIYKLDNDYDKKLFCSVVAVEDGGVIIKAYSRDSIFLSGSKSNNLISNFWHGQTMKIKNMSTYNEKDSQCLHNYHNYLNKEIDNHNEDLYGAFLYSLDIALRIMEYNEVDMSYSAFANKMKKEITDGSYVSKHNIAMPILDCVITMGDLPLLYYFDFYQHMLII